MSGHRPGVKLSITHGPMRGCSGELICCDKADVLVKLSDIAPRLERTEVVGGTVWVRRVDTKPVETAQ